MSQNTNNTNPDAPRNWELYADLLRRHGHAEPPAGMDRRLSLELGRRTSGQTTSQRLKNGTLIGCAVVALLMITFRLVSDSAGKANVGPEPVAPNTVLEQPDIFANPEIPPVWVDTNLPAFEPMPFPDPGDFGSIDGSLELFFMAADTLIPTDRPVTGD